MTLDASNIHVSIVLPNPVHNSHTKRVKMSLSLLLCSAKVPLSFNFWVPNPGAAAAGETAPGTDDEIVTCMVAPGNEMTLRWFRSIENCVAKRLTVPGPSSTSPLTCTAACMHSALPPRRHCILKAVPRWFVHAKFPRYAGEHALSNATSAVASRTSIQHAGHEKSVEENSAPEPSREARGRERIPAGALETWAH